MERNAPQMYRNRTPEGLGNLLIIMIYFIDSNKMVESPIESLGANVVIIYNVSREE